jgi:hypothetical protein
MKIIVVFLSYFILLIQGFEIRVLFLLTSYSINLATCPALFWFYFLLHLWSCTFTEGLALDHDSSTSASFLDGIKDVQCTNNLVFFFCYGMALNHNTPDLCFLGSWDFRHVPSALILVSLKISVLV